MSVHYFLIEGVMFRGDKAQQELNVIDLPITEEKGLDVLGGERQICCESRYCLRLNEAYDPSEVLS